MSRARLIALFTSFLASVAFPAVPAPGAASAAVQEDPHAACAAAPSYVPAEILQRPVPLRSGIGNSHEPVTTASKEAQAYYDQGLNYLESYVWIEAARSFHQALRIDPNLAMAYVGLSRVSSGLDDPAAATQFLEKAKTLASLEKTPASTAKTLVSPAKTPVSPGKTLVSTEEPLVSKVTDRERRRIEIREKQLAAMADIEDTGKFLAYKKTLDDALAADLEDPQLWLLRGNAEEANASGRGQRGTAGSVAFYEQVLRLVPDHASAHHYLVHSYENIGRIDKALEHGEAYARLAPAIPHAAHMWGHDLRRAGQVDEAIAQFLKADKLEREYYQAEKIDPGLDWHHGHNLDLLATCYEHKGQMRLAEKTMREAAGLGALDANRAFNAREMPSFLIHRARYPEALEAARAMTRTAYPQSRTVGHALAGRALLGLGRVEEAGKELEEARRELDSVPRVTSGTVPRRSIVEPWVDALRGELLMRTGSGAEGRALLEEVQRELRAIPGPDAWSQTLFLLETMARSAREAGDWDLSEHTAEQMIDHDAAYAGSHLALGLVLQRKGDAAGAAREFQVALSLWRDADPGLPELRLIPAGLSPKEPEAGGGR
jgi:tetratricopeptide (TPR) repeat protein